MSVLVLMLAALAQSQVSSDPPAAQDPDDQQVDVVARPPERRRVCRTIMPSNSRIPSRRICQTQAEREAERDAEQSDAARAMNPTNERTGQQLNTSGYGNYARERWPRPVEAPR
ncbi:MAG: hypothetical protein ACXWU1_13200 [Allosphingosinicella sp.]